MYNKKYYPWIEKYRPKTINQLTGQTELKKLMNNIILTGSMPNLLLYGPPGTGKTSSILAICKQLFGEKNYNSRVTELNASNERGINVVRGKISNIVKSSLSQPDENYPSPNVNVIILDEADEMTQDAQAALRKFMEEPSNSTRFVLICNNINKIIDPIISRCSTFKFKKLNEKYIFDKLKYICANENVIINDEALKCISNISNGDLRKAIILLQNNKDNSVDEILKSVNIPSDKQINKFINNVLNSDIRNIPDIVQKFINKSFSIEILFEKISYYIIHNYDDNNQIYNLLIDISTAEIYIKEFASDYLNLLSIMIKFKYLHS